MAKLLVAALLAFALLPVHAVRPGLAETRESTMTFSPEDYITGAWLLYKSVFVKDGRVMDPSNGNISHSEGQGYAMLLAVAADDKASFKDIWDWTRQELYVRGDELAAWKWDPAAENHVVDSNNASDGDLLIAWALMRAAEKWKVDDYRQRAKRIADEIADLVVVEDRQHGTILLPAAIGFAGADQPDGPIVNLSYWIFPALGELKRLDSKLPTEKLLESGRKLLRQARFGPSGMPSDWLSLADKDARPAARFAPNFGYEAVRLPLYAAWAGPEDAALLARVHERWNRDGRNLVQVIELATSASLVAMPDPGYQAIAELLSCSLGKPGDPTIFTGFEPTEYYPSTLHLMSVVAISERYPQCLPNLN
ncbi:MAG: glycosyl hydrolase family 5 [Rhizobium sp.]|jgi:endo-1,4-beta-D-glucanase Y|nr:glycosyl hydrolase family 5 [Rhizobium sp.]